MSDTLNELRQRVSSATTADEADIVNQLLARNSLSASRHQTIVDQSIALVQICRSKSSKAGTLEAFLQEFGLDNKEGIALMCLAEALLRVPDSSSADRLIAEKITSGDWGTHKGKSSSSFVNASVWGLMLTGSIVRLDPAITDDAEGWMRAMVGKLGEPVIRGAVHQAMRIMAGQYVMGRTLQEGLKRSSARNPSDTLYSFDMLGEGARSARAADKYFAAYADAIKTLGSANSAKSIVDANSISVKLSALHPRFEFSQEDRIRNELLPRIKELALLAKAGGIGFSIDAEEADRLESTLDIFEALARDPELQGWEGLGFVLQAYQKRSYAVADWLIELARISGHRFMVRLVKGAYWDSEIKAAQEEGLADYPVFTRKCHSDVSYHLCAERLLSAQQNVFPQFATHNAHTVATVLELARGKEFELQRLHGMGQLLFDELLNSENRFSDGNDSAPKIRIYAPIGSHQDLLPYLVRRLLENGANSSFVNRFLDARMAPEKLLQDPFRLTSANQQRRHGQIPLPRDLYASEQLTWKNSIGINLANPQERLPAYELIQSAANDSWRAASVVNGISIEHEQRDVFDPADHEKLIGQVFDADVAEVERAISFAISAESKWNKTDVEVRAACLEEVANLFESHKATLIGLIVSEAGRTLADALAEVREAVDFCRYYAAQARELLRPQTLPGPTGEENELSLHGRGVFVCISPWNFPLAIFSGQIAAALVTGNAVIAKPAEQTALVAAKAVELMHAAGIPAAVLQLLLGAGSKIGAALVSDSRIAGVVFTGSTATARQINQQLAKNEGAIVPLIAETGGLNAMLVDSTALPEQVVDDVIASAFGSAGQRCSALRVLFLQEEIADNLIELLCGAMDELQVGDPLLLKTDVGPVIDRAARQNLEKHSKRMSKEAKLLFRAELDASTKRGFFVPPQVYEIVSINQLPEEVFGPVLHIIRYSADKIDSVIQDINQTGFGLTLGVHSRINGFAKQIFRNTRVGNTYINRNMIGAVVGVNPFGGQGLSGTGPKAGGPHYLHRFVTEKTLTDNVVARGGNAKLFSLQDE